MTGAGEPPFPTRSKAPLELHLPVATAEEKASLLLARASGLSQGRIKEAMTKGAVWLESGGRPRRLRRGDHRPRPGDLLHLYYDRRILDAEPEPPVLVRDLGAFSIWIKPAGLFSQGSRWGDHCTLHRRVERHLEPRRPAFPVHRLDRATRGLMLVAHRKGTAAALAALFRERRVEKRYTALVHGRFPAGETVCDSPIDGRPARSRIRCLRHLEGSDRSLVEVTIDSGRKHQVRRHLAQLGHPLVGDRLHGNGTDPGDLQLVASHLAFDSPSDGNRLEFRLHVAVTPGAKPDSLELSISSE